MLSIGKIEEISATGSRTSEQLHAADVLLVEFLTISNMTTCRCTLVNRG